MYWTLLVFFIYCSLIANTHEQRVFQVQTFITVQIKVAANYCV